MPFFVLGYLLMKPNALNINAKDEFPSATPTQEVKPYILVTTADLLQKKDGYQKNRIRERMEPLMGVVHTVV